MKLTHSNCFKPLQCDGYDVVGGKNPQVDKLRPGSGGSGSAGLPIVPPGTFGGVGSAAAAVASSPSPQSGAAHAVNNKR